MRSGPELSRIRQAFKAAALAWAGLLCFVLAVVGVSGDALAEKKKLDLGPDGLPRMQMGAVYAEPPSRGASIDLRHEFKELDDGDEIELVNIGKEWKHPFKIQVKQDIVAPDRPLIFNLTPGQYELRSDEGKRSFTVDVDPPKPILPLEGAQLSLLGNEEGVFPFEWESDPKAKEYYFEIKDHRGRLTKRIHTHNTWVYVVLDEPGKYTWRVVTLTDPRNLKPTGTRVLTGSYEVSNESTGAKKVRLTVEPIPRVVMYQVEVNALVPIPGVSNRAVVINSWRPNVDLKVLPGSYTLRSRAYFIDKGYTEWGPPQVVSVPLGPTNPAVPVNLTRFPAETVDENEVTLAWDAHPLASAYWLDVVDRDGKQIFSGRVVGTTHKLRELEHNQVYRWDVYALLPLQTPPQTQGRRPASLLEKGRSEFRVQNYPGNNFATPEEPSFLYGWLKSSFAILGYEGLDYDRNARIQQSQLTTRAEAAIGYWKPRDTWGLLGYVGQTWLNSQLVTTSYISGGVLVGRRFELGERDRLRVWGGFAQRQLPAYQGNPLTGRIDMYKTSSLGPDARFFYMRGIDDQYGIQASLGLYFDAVGLQTPNGRPLTPTLQFDGSVGVTYRASRSFKLYGGYLFQNLTTRYQSTRPGQTNTSSAIGHSGVFTIEFGLRASEPIYLRPGED